MTKTRTGIAAALVTTVWVAGAVQAKPVDQTARVRAGIAAPTFTLDASDGTTVSLTERRGEKNVILVFFRGTW